MTATKTTHWERLERWSPTLLYISGIFFVLLAIQNVAQFGQYLLNTTGNTLSA